MNTVKINKGSALMVAHRGVSGLERENTLSAFIAAGNRSYFGIETDVHRTADGKYVVIHDDSTGRVGQDNIVIENSTYDLIKSVKLYDIDGNTPRTDLRIPLLSEYIRVCKKYEKIAVLELKTIFTKEQVAEIVDIIKEEDYLDGVIFISFHIQDLIFLRELYPDQPAQFLTGEISERTIGWMKDYKLDLDAHFPSITEENHKMLHDLGIKVNVWTVDDPATAEKLVAWGVDYITTNILE